MPKDVYESVGVPGYIVFDPTGDLIAPALHAWSLDGDVYVRWTADKDGWWRSESLDKARTCKGGGLDAAPDPPLSPLHA